MQERLRHAQDLIRHGHYTEARDILNVMDHPLARRWLAKLDQRVASGRVRVPWYIIWFQVLREPRVETFEAILRQAGVSVWRASVWVLVSIWIGVGFSAMAPFAAQGLLQYVFQMEIFAYILSALFIVFVAGFIGLAAFWIDVILTQSLARLVGGEGTVRQLGYCYAIVYALFILTSQLVLGLNALFPATSILFTIDQMLVLVISFYSLVLYLRATRAVNGFGIGKSLLVMTIGSIGTLLLLAALGSVFGLF